MDKANPKPYYSCAWQLLKALSLLSEAKLQVHCNKCSPRPALRQRLKLITQLCTFVLPTTLNNIQRQWKRKGHQACPDLIFFGGEGSVPTSPGALIKTMQHDLFF